MKKGKKQKIDLDKIFRQLLPNTKVSPPVKVSQYLSAADATNLFYSLNGIPWDVLLNRYGLALYRKTKTFYEGDLTAATNYMNAYGDKGAKPILFSQAPAELVDLRKRLQQDYGLAFSVCYINYYFSNKAAIGWHQDREEHGAPDPLPMVTVYGSGIGEIRPFAILEMNGHVGKNAWEVPTGHGDLIEMPVGFHDKYFHGALSQRKFARPRISLTFRNPDLSHHGKWRWYKTPPQVWDCHAGKDYSPDAVYVGCKVRSRQTGKTIREGTVYGNDLVPMKGHGCWVADNEADFREYAEQMMRIPSFREQAIKELRGKHLLCWCVQEGTNRTPFCHARVWLDLANPQEPKEKDWRLVKGFLSKEQADWLYKQMDHNPDWISGHDHPTHAFFISYGKSYDKGSVFGVKGEIPQIPEFLDNLGKKVSKEANAPVNYVQCHKYGPVVPVRPHHDPAGVIVPMLVVGQERIFRVGGKMLPEYYRMAQAKREVSGHTPEEEILLQHGDLLIFNGGRTIHSMYPAERDKQFNPNGFDWRFSILFRWTTDIMRKHGPGTEANEAGQQNQYKEEVQKWRESRSGEKWDDPPKGIYFPDYLTPQETQAIFDAYMGLGQIRPHYKNSFKRFSFPHFNDTGQARNKMYGTSDNPPTRKAPRSVRKLLAKLSKDFKRTVNYVSAIAYENNKIGMDYHNHKEDLGHDTPVWIFSTGDTRAFGIREKATGKEIRFKAEPGSLIVLPNSYNTTHEHAVLNGPTPRGMRIALNMKAVDEKY